MNTTESIAGKVSFKTAEALKTHELVWEEKKQAYRIQGTRYHAPKVALAGFLQESVDNFERVQIQRNSELANKEITLPQWAQATRESMRLTREAQARIILGGLDKSKPWKPETGDSWVAGWAEIDRQYVMRWVGVLMKVDFGQVYNGRVVNAADCVRQLCHHLKSGDELRRYFQ